MITRLTLFLILTISGSYLSAQERAFTVAGTIVDQETREPLPFATIFYSEKQFGTTATENGIFRLLIPAGDAGDTLVFSFVGYQPKKITIDEATENDLFSLIPRQLEAITVAARQDKFDLDKYMKQVITNFIENWNYETHLAYGQVEAAVSKGREIVFLTRSLGYAIHIELPKNWAKYSNYKFIAENTGYHANENEWSQLGYNTSSFPNFPVSSVFRSVRVLQENGLLSRKNPKKYRFQLDSVIEQAGRPYYYVRFKGPGESGTLFVDASESRIVSIDYTTSSFWGVIVNRSVRADVALRFSYNQDTPYLSTAFATYEKSGYRHQQSYRAIIQKNVTASISQETYQAINSFDNNPYIVYDPTESENRGLSFDLDQIEFDEESFRRSFTKNSGFLYQQPGQQPAESTLNSYQEVKKLIEQFK